MTLEPGARALKGSFPNGVWKGIIRERAVERSDSSEPVKIRVVELDTRFTHWVNTMFLQPPMTIGGCFRGIPRNSSPSPDPRNPPIVIGGWSKRSATALSRIIERVGIHEIVNFAA